MEENIEDIIVFLLYNIKGRKKKRDDWITIAKKCEEALKYIESYEKLAEKLSVHPETIRSILKLLELPEEAKKLVKERKIGMDTAQRITRIKNIEDQIKAAKLISDMNAHTSRDLIRYIQRKPNATLEEYEQFKKKITEQKKNIKDIHLTITHFDEETFKKLEELASKQKISISKLIKRLVKESLEKELK